jgi:hypothetical protein
VAKRETDPLSALEALGRATENLEPSDAFSDALMASLEPSNARLERLARQTDSLDVGPSFTDEVMRSVTTQPRETAWSEGVVRLARFALVGAAAAAAVCLFLSSQAERGYDSAVIESVAAVEVDE